MILSGQHHRDQPRCGATLEHVGAHRFPDGSIAATYLRITCSISRSSPGRSTPSRRG
jgi:hypothetical protein